MCLYIYRSSTFLSHRSRHSQVVMTYTGRAGAWRGCQPKNYTRSDVTATTSPSGVWRKKDIRSLSMMKLTRTSFSHFASYYKSNLKHFCFFYMRDFCIFLFFLLVLSWEKKWCHTFLLLCTNREFSNGSNKVWWMFVPIKSDTPAHVIEFMLLIHRNSHNLQLFILLATNCNH